jgi:hypothetical protein
MKRLNFQKLTLVGTLVASLIWGQTPAKPEAQPPKGAKPEAAKPAEPVPAKGTVLTDPYRRIRIITLSGRNGINRLTEGIIATPVVEVRDANDQPIEGATVTFQAPETGPGGTFAGGKYQLQVRTDVAGQAIADGFQPNTMEGSFRLKVVAAYEGVQAQTELAMANSRRSLADDDKARASGRRKKWLWIGLAAAAGGAAVGVLATRNGGSSGTTVSVTPGPVIIGGR